MVKFPQDIAGVKSICFYRSVLAAISCRSSSGLFREFFDFHKPVKFPCGLEHHWSNNRISRCFSFSWPWPAVRDVRATHQHFLRFAMLASLTSPQHPSIFAYAELQHQAAKCPRLPAMFDASCGLSWLFPGKPHWAESGGCFRIGDTRAISRHWH